MTTKDQSELFDAYYFQHDCGLPYERNEQWLILFERIAKRIVSEINPKSVLDAGCAMGFLVEGLRNHGIDAWGVDISEYAIGQVHESVKPYCKVASITDPLNQFFDLIVNIEVLEHMPPRDAEVALSNLCQSTDVVLFSSTPFDYKEVTHINVQSPEYWAGLFAGNGFIRDFDFDASFITPWAVKYERKDYQIQGLIRNYERRYFQLWKENVDLRQLSTDIQSQLSKQFSLLREKQVFILEIQAQLEKGKETLAELKLTNQQLTADVTERDEVIRGLTDQVVERDQAVQGLKDALTVSENEIVLYTLSSSWKITRPLRKLNKLFKGNKDD